MHYIHHTHACTNGSRALDGKEPFEYRDCEKDCLACKVGSFGPITEEQVRDIILAYKEEKERKFPTFDTVQMLRES